MVILSIAKNTFKESARNKISIVILLLAIACILLTKAVAYVSPETEEKMVVDFGISAITFFGVVMAIFNGSSLIYKELEKRTIYTVVSKPIHRFEFVIGKFTGLFFSISLNLMMMTAIFTIYCWLMKIPLSLTFFIAIAFIFLQICMIIGISMVFSLLSSPLLSATFSLMFYIFGYWLEGLKDLIVLIENKSGQIVVEWVYKTLPKLFYLDFKYQASHGFTISNLELIFAAIYGITYVCVFLLLSTLILNKKEL